mmetsp:Transcript_157/g.328  ORF Transcript_157/g.328 Transcript_157/m.328 type:complete len:288 (+) Transcript_157:41-904(+)|eukprot:CAMPEP_0175161902 /NCGR_PEP_ID=MMETSP0087-20121206/24861_1 /TAXON_ID=136419 /ORGANISM="Unknown Unknown, Strain D1" /LENGTH=287 /DNA_ID=CAMNT_0016450365 /DNA_START=28 /DNA_END=891 /DNA_ORIENTATION=+
MVVTPKWFPDFKLIILLVGVLCFEVSFVFVMLKEDQQEEKAAAAAISHWSWAAIVGVPVATGGLFCCIWSYWNFVVLRPPSFQKLRDPKTLTYLDPIEMEKYLELEMFRRTLLMVWYAFFTGSSIYISGTHCISCETPYKMLAFVCAFTYGMRFLTLMYTTFKCYFRNNLAIKELIRFQEAMDDHRLFKQAFRDIADSFTGNSFWFNTALFFITVILSVVASTWIVNKNCFHECHNIYLNTKVLILGICVVEIFFSASSCVERYFRRSSGVEILEKIVKIRTRPGSK